MTTEPFRYCIWCSAKLYGESGLGCEPCKGTLCRSCCTIFKRGGRPCATTS